VDNGALTLDDDTVSGNSATNGGGIVNNSFLSLSGATVSGNSATNGGGIVNNGLLDVGDSTLSGNTAVNGGGIDSFGSLRVDDSTLSGNSALNGGGVASFGANTSITDSTLSGNAATNGGGLYDGIVMALVDASTLSGNTATNGGGMYVSNGDEKVTTGTIAGNTAVSGGGIFTNNAALTITNSTVSGNDATGAGGQDGGGIMGGAVVAATIVADSLSGGDCSGRNGDLGYNLDDDGTCGFSAANHGQSDVNPELGPLEDNGGPTETEAPASNSPVVNQIPLGAKVKKPKTILCPGTDQRGLARPQGSACDIGAVELVIGPDAITSADSAVATKGSPLSFGVTTIGSPTPSIALIGKLPKGLRLADNGNGTATIAGTPTRAGTKTVKISATFGTGPTAVVVTDPFTVTVESGLPPEARQP
jgi:hypothetical protein